MLIFEPGWDSQPNNNAARPLGETALAAAIVEVMQKLKNRTTDQEFIYLINHVESDSPLAKAKVVKGLHQEVGNQIIPDTHCTLEIADFPYPKRFHISFMWIRRGKNEGWHPYQITHEQSARVYKKVDVL